VLLEPEGSTALTATRPFNLIYSQCDVLHVRLRGQYDVISVKNSDQILTVRPIFFASVLSVILAKGLSAPQHSTYLVILEGDRFLAPAWSAFSAKFELEELRLPSSGSVSWNATDHLIIRYDLLRSYKQSTAKLP